MANPADLVRKAEFTVNPGSESGRPAPGDARFANGQFSTTHGIEILSLLVFESTQKRDTYATSMTRSGPDFRYVIGDRLVAYLGAAHSTGPHGQDVTTFPLSPPTGSPAPYSPRRRHHSPGRRTHLRPALDRLEGFRHATGWPVPPPPPAHR